MLLNSSWNDRREIYFNILLPVPDWVGNGLVDTVKAKNYRIIISCEFEKEVRQIVSFYLDPLLNLLRYALKSKRFIIFSWKNKEIMKKLTRIFFVIRYKRKYFFKTYHNIPGEVPEQNKYVFNIFQKSIQGHQTWPPTPAPWGGVGIFVILNGNPHLLL